MLRPNSDFVLMVGLALVACSPKAEARRQWLIEVDTNAPISGELQAEPHWADVAVDSLRVDVDDFEPNQFVVPDVHDWPVSFGVVVPDGVAPPLVRLRAFQSVRSTPEPGKAVSNPTRSLAIDRLVALPAADGATRVHVELDLGCMGVLVQFGAAPTTCVDAEHPNAAPSEGVRVTADAAHASRVGTSPLLEIRECSAPGTPERRCIPGGLSVIGDESFDGFGAVSVFRTPTPPRAFRFSAFFMDRFEVTVERYKSVVASLNAPEPQAPGPGLFQYCSWLGMADTSHDAYPLTCVDRQTADAVCAAFGGTLPTEAQWEHAARGRGRGLRYTWGNEPATCCRASAGRLQGDCPGELGPEPVGSHPPESCDGLGDVTEDGVVDMVGSVFELVRGDFLPYDDSCWSDTALSLDPDCEVNGKSQGTRGGHWGAHLGTVATPLRPESQFASPVGGFRCVYGDPP